MRITIPNEPPCTHAWSPYTIHKAKCRKCKHARPWADIVAELKVRDRVTMQTVKGMARTLDEVRRALARRGGRGPSAAST